MRSNTAKPLHRILLCVLIQILFPLQNPSAQPNAPDDISPDQFRANFLMNLVLKREWLKEMSRRELATEGVVIVVIHDDDVRKRIFETSKKVQVPITILDSLADLDGKTPHFVYFGSESTDQELNALDSLSDTYATTVGESSDFFRRGGCFRINLEVPPRSKERMMYNRQIYLDSRVQYKTELFRNITQAKAQD